MLRRSTLLLASLSFVALVGCRSSAPAPASPTTPSEPVPAGPGAEPTVTLPGMGEPCAADDGCASGLSCVTYYGIAGPRGPAFKSCEISCESDAAVCPTGTICQVVADGPGQVCRPKN